MRSDARKRQDGDHWAHPDPGVRELILEACADAWDEGHRDVCNDCCCRPGINPYRDRP